MKRYGKVDGHLYDNLLHYEATENIYKEYIKYGQKMPDELREKLSSEPLIYLSISRPVNLSFSSR